jgi:hypothetical protein
VASTAGFTYSSKDDNTVATAAVFYNDCFWDCDREA